jgi:peptidoglycan/LPS O-acetylase OafA/YrhL
MAIGIALACGLPADLHRTLRFGVGAALLLFGAVAYERNFGVPKFGLPHLIGDSSYSLYLSHLYAVVALRHIWLTYRLPLAGSVSTLVFVVLAIGGAVALGISSFWIVERPIVMWGHRVVTLRRASNPPQTKSPVLGAP